MNGVNETLSLSHGVEFQCLSLMRCTFRTDVFLWMVKSCECLGEILRAIGELCKVTTVSFRFYLIRMISVDDAVQFHTNVQCRQHDVIRLEMVENPIEQLNGKGQ